MYDPSVMQISKSAPDPAKAYGADFEIIALGLWEMTSRGSSIMGFGVRACVFVAFLLLGASFVAGTALLFYEFGPETGLLFATHDSHLFLFFPTLGLVALAAFYLPSCAFVDMYWKRHVRFGRARLIVGLATLASVSFVIGSWLAASPYRSVWDLSPAALAADKSEPAQCGGPDRPCERIALLDGIKNIAAVSHEQFGLQEFVRSCDTRRLVEGEGPAERKRFCFASTALSSKPRLSTDEECCRAQTRYQNAIVASYQRSDNRSLTGRVHAVLLPLKVFFLLILLAIGAHLAARHTGVAFHYPAHVDRIEISVLVGAAAMVFFPLMSQGFVQTGNALFGLTQDEGFKPIVPLMSFIFGAWALLILLFIFRKHDTEIELAAKLAGVAASTIAVIKYDLLVALIVRFLGSGAGVLSVILLIALSVLAIIVLSSPKVRQLIAGERKADVSGRS